MELGLSYKDAGVDINAGEEVVARISNDVESTFGPEVLTGIGSFGALFAPDLGDYEQPVFVAGTDGVGTKLKVAFMMEKHDTVGVDLVAMCVNDILAQGAKPLFFLDYIATGKMNPGQVEEIVKGITAGCQQAECALIGGETAEMPDFYGQSEYDLAGFAVGMVDKNDIITGENIKAGDKIIGLAADGIHSNGYSLARKVFFEAGKLKPENMLDELDGSLGEELLKPTRIYVQPVLKLLQNYQINGIAHITGGGLIENIARILPQKTAAVVEKDSWKISPIFTLMQELGDIKEKEMYRTFNMGVGMTLIVPSEIVDSVIEEANKIGEKAYLIGEIRESENNSCVKFS